MITLIEANAIAITVLHNNEKGNDNKNNNIKACLCILLRRSICINSLIISLYELGSLLPGLPANMRFVTHLALCSKFS